MDRSPDFVGRHEELAALRHTLEGSARAVSVVGMGGVGKSRLVKELSAGAAAKGMQVWGLQVDDADGAEPIAHAVARAVGLTAGVEPSSAITEFLRSTAGLLVLDGCDTRSIEIAAMVSTVFAETAAAHIVITSRAPLGFTGEQVIAVRAFDMESAQGIQEAKSLFAAQAFPHGRIEAPWSSADVTEVCRAVGALPLGIMMAARSARLAGPEAMRRQAGTLLGSGGSDSSPLVAALEWSYSRLSGPAQRAWTTLAFLSGAFTRDCAAALLADPSADATLVELVDANVLVPERAGDDIVLRAPDTVREYGQRMGAIDRTLLTTRLVEYAAALGRSATAEIVSSNQKYWSARAMTERPVLRQALTLSLYDPDLHPHSLDILFRSYHSLWWSTGDSIEAARWASRFATSRDALVRGWGLTFSAALGGVHESAERKLAIAGRIASDHDDQSLLFAVMYSAGIASLMRGHFDDAILAGMQIQLEAPGNESDENLVGLQLCADASYGLGDLENATASALKILESVEHLDEIWHRSLALRALALIRSRRGAHKEAIDLAREALRVSATSVGLTPAVAALQTVAVVAQRGGRAPLAAFLEGIVDANAVTVAFSRSILTATGDIPAMRTALVRDLGRARYEEIIRIGRRTAVHSAIRIALEESPLPFEHTEDERTRSLTAREREVAELLAEGASNQEIAERLFISRRTVESHVERAMRKLDLTRRSQIGAYLRKP